MSESQPEGSLTSQVVNLLKHAATEYRRAFELNAINVGAAQGYVDCLLALRQSKDALLFAQSLYKRFPSNPKIELLLGTILSKSKAPKTLEKAKLLFKNSLKHFRQVKANSTQAVLALSQLMMDCNEGDKAVELLKSQIEFSVSKSNIDAVDLMHLYCKQGDISASIGLQNEAFECYNMAIRSSPTGICDEASQALEQLQEKNSQRRMQLISTGDDYFENQIPSNSFEIPEQSREFSPIIPY